MSAIKRLTVMLPTDLIARVDRLERNRNRFIAEAAARELERRRGQALRGSLRSSHPESTKLVDAGLANWAADVPADDVGLVDPAGGTPVRWIEGQGWVTESA